MMRDNKIPSLAIGILLYVGIRVDVEKILKMSAFICTCLQPLKKELLILMVTEQLLLMS